MSASKQGQLDVVNRLLDFKQIDVNAQDAVCWNIDCNKNCIFEFSFPVFRLDVGVKYIVEW